MPVWEQIARNRRHRLIAELVALAVFAFIAAMIGGGL